MPTPKTKRGNGGKFTPNPQPVKVSTTDTCSPTNPTWSEAHITSQNKRLESLYKIKQELGDIAMRLFGTCPPDVEGGHLTDSQNDGSVSGELSNLFIEQENILKNIADKIAYIGKF